MCRNVRIKAAFHVFYTFLVFYADVGFFVKKKKKNDPNTLNYYTTAIQF